MLRLRTRFKVVNLMHRSLRVLVLVMSIGVLVLGSSTAANAVKPFEKGHYEGSDSFTEPDFCGIEVQFDVTFSGVFHTHPVPHSDQAFFGFDNYRFTEIISTAEGSIRTEGNGVFREQHATHISGDIWEFEFLDAGTFRVYDSDGNLLLRANGVFKASEQFDTLGDFQPGGIPVPDTFQVLHEAGQSFNDEEFCAAVLPELT